MKRTLFSPLLTILTAIIILSVTSCLKKEDFDFDKLVYPDWEPNFSLPLVYSSLDLSQVLNEVEDSDMLIEDAQHFLTLVYKRRLMSQIAQEVFEIDNQTFNNNHSFSLPAGFSVGDSSTFTFSDDFVFATTNNEVLDTLYLKEGTLDLQIQSNINHDTRIRVFLPTVRRNGVPFVETINQVYTGTPYNINLSFDLEDYVMAFHHSGGMFNQLPINYEITAFNNSGASDLSPYVFDCNVGFDNLAYEKMIGFLDYIEYQFNDDSLSIDIFKNSWFGNFLLQDPKLFIRVTNSLGFPLEIVFDYLEGYNPNTSVNVPITGVSTPISVNQPAYMGDITTTTIELNKDNSNIKDAINDMPHHLHYRFDGHANPTGIYTPNFVLDTSAFKVDIELEMPLYGQAWDFTIQDTIDYEFEQLEEVVYAKFLIDITNGFPIDAGIQIYFADTTYQVIDSLFTYKKEIITAAPVGSSPNYRVVERRHKYTEIFLSASRLENISKARHMIIAANMATTNTGTDIVKIYSDYLIDVRLAIQAQLKVNLNDL